MSRAFPTSAHSRAKLLHLLPPRGQEWEVTSGEKDPWERTLAFPHLVLWKLEVGTRAGVNSSLARLICFSRFTLRMVVRLIIGIFLNHFWKAVFTHSVLRQWLLQWHIWSLLLAITGGLQRNSASQSWSHGPRACTDGFAAAELVSLLQTNKQKTKQIKIAALKPLKENFLIKGIFPICGYSKALFLDPLSFARALFGRSLQGWPGYSEMWKLCLPFCTRFIQDTGDSYRHDDSTLCVYVCESVHAHIHMLFMQERTWTKP